MDYISLFSGIGGFEYGIEHSNKKNVFNCIGFSEVDKYAENIYKKHYPNHPRLGDATKIQTEDLPRFDLLVGGFPCQAFSIAGKRGGFDDTRGTLFFEIARVLEAKKPRYILLENVRGLLSHDKGRTWQEMLRILSDLGYNVTWQVLNSKNHGVPQNRERMYIKGFLREECGREVLCQRKSGEEADVQQEETNGKEIVQLNKGVSQDCRVLSPDGVGVTLGANGGGLGAKTGLYQVDIKVEGNISKNGKSNSENVINPDGLCPTLLARDYKGAKPIIVQDEPTIKKVGNYCINNKSQSGAVYDEEGLSPTLRSDAKSTPKIVDEPKIKKVGNTCIDGKCQGGHVYDVERLSPTLLSGQWKYGTKILVENDAKKGYNDTKENDESKKILIKNNTKKGYLEAEEGDGLVLNHPNCRGRVQKQSSPTITTRSEVGIITTGEAVKLQNAGEYNSNYFRGEVAQTLRTNQNIGTVCDDFRIRRLTPVECERLQGFPDNWTQYGANGDLISDTQRYKCCGNAVTTNVISYIMNNWKLYDIERGKYV